MTPPSTIAHYKITTKLGEGGMGAVYRATDTKLARDVAIKVLPESVAGDADRLARFTREAQVLASLNHPNIAAIYGVENRALILELVEGPTLAERLAQGPIPMDEALPIARQIAEAMEFAHERGIVHRDLKPANIKIRNDGTVKVLDFGLAKALSPQDVSGSSDAMNSPTLTARATQIGVILGTAAYMSPEQAKGKSVDRRADIWAFGVVVFEMLTGKRGYQADDVSDTLAAVLTRELDWTALPADTPPRLRTLLRDCLARDPKQRLRDIGEARRVLDQLISGPPDSNAPALSSNIAVSAPSSVWRRVFPWTIAGLAVVAAVVMLLQRPGTNTGDERELRLQMVMPGDTTTFAISPDGRLFAFSATAANGNGAQLWLRPLDSEVAKPLAGTEQSFEPFWSPDSKSIGFFGHQAMKLLDVESGAVRTLADAPTPRGASWNRDGTILFSPAGNGPLYRIPATGGKPEQVTQQRAQDASHRFPQFLPDGHNFLFWVHGPPDVRGVYVGSLDSKEFHRICVADGPAVFVPPNHLLLVRERVLYAQRFDPAKMELAGDPFPVTAGLSAGWASFMRVAASNTGLIVYRLDETTRRQVTWLDRSGRPAGTVGEPVADARSADLSPDGRTLAISIGRGEGGANDVMLMDMSRGTLTRLTVEDSGYPNWSPDGTRISFQSGRVGLLDLYTKVVGSGGPDEVLFASKEAKNLDDWSPDGKYILFSTQSPTTARDVWAVPVDGADRKPFPVAQTAAEETNGRFSPDGKWVAYQSDETGHFEVFVRPFPGAGSAVRVSTGGGGSPFWRHDGKELFYRTTDDQLMAVWVGASGRGTLDFGLPQSLFKIKGIVVPESDGQRFLWLLPNGNVSSQPPITVIVNWAGQQK
jgi:serine/threonine protein kinase/Tol biopolymer transport system component